jgi:hypothetical protein
MTFAKPWWWSQAACLGVGPDAFFPAKGTSWKVPELCKTCPVATACGRYAIANHLDAGTWGGLSERARRRARGGAPRAKQVAAPNRKRYPVTWRTPVRTP